MSASVVFLDDYLQGSEDEELTYSSAWARAKEIQEQAQSILSESELLYGSEACAFLYEDPIFFSVEEPSRAFSLVLLADLSDQSDILPGLRAGVSG